MAGPTAHGEAQEGAPKDEAGWAAEEDGREDQAVGLECGGRERASYLDAEGAVHILGCFATPSFSPLREPAARVVSGAEVVFHTSDECYKTLSQLSQIPGQHARWTIGDTNAVTGPLHIEGAKPGDALHIDVLDVTVERCWSVWIADDDISGCLAGKLAATGRRAAVRQLQIDHANQTVQISDRLHVPLEPMIGCIATAPEPHDECHWNCGCSTLEPTFKHGGNMDLRELRKGAAIVLPVQNEGGLLFLGDLHACMVSPILWRVFDMS